MGPPVDRPLSPRLRHICHHWIGDILNAAYTIILLLVQRARLGPKAVQHGARAGQRLVESATDLCLSLDGSRVGGREFLLVFLVGRASDGRLSMWGPPQVVPRHPWSQRHRSPIFAGEAPFRDPQIASHRKLSEDSQNRVFTESLGTSGKCAILRTFSELQFRPSEFSEPGAAAFLGIGPSPSSYGGQT